MNKINWKCLKHIDLEQQKFDFLSLDCFNVFGDNKGILIIFNHSDVICVKLKSSQDSSLLLTLSEVGKIKGIRGSSIIKDNLNTFLLSNDGSLYVYKSFKRIHEIPVMTNVRLFQFNGSCYVLIELTEMSLKIKLYDSFDSAESEEKCEFDLSFPDDCVTIGGNRNKEVMCVLMVENVSDEEDTKFFAELLACNLTDETISDVLLISIDEKIFWVKYSGSFVEGAISGHSIELLTISKSKILGIHYHKGTLMTIDDESNLSIFYFCSTTRIIRKKEISIGHQISSFKFTESQFVYSTSDKMTLLDLKDPSKPSEKIANIKQISCFTIVNHLQFIIAICRNNFVYHIPLNENFQPNDVSEGWQTNFISMQDSDYDEIPEVIKFCEIEEKKLVETEKQIKNAQKLNIFLKRLEMEQRDFIASKATIKFHRDFLYCYDENVRICGLNGQQLQNFNLEIEIQFHEIFTSLNLTLIVSHENSRSTSIKTLKMENVKEVEKLVLPGVIFDEQKCDITMKLLLNFSQHSPFTYDVQILSIQKPEIPKLILHDDLDRCIDVIKKLKT